MACALREKHQSQAINLSQRISVPLGNSKEPSSTSTIQRSLSFAVAQPRSIARVCHGAVVAIVCFATILRTLASLIVELGGLQS